VLTLLFRVIAFYQGAKREKTLFDKRSSYQNQQALQENSG